jgi:hypothetical protein
MFMGLFSQLLGHTDVTMGPGILIWGKRPIGKTTAHHLAKTLQVD